MTGPLAQQFAQVRVLGERLLAQDSWEKPHVDAGLAALSVIERHVQDMTGYECAHEHRWWMADMEPRRCPVCGTITFAALPAREKGEE